MKQNILFPNPLISQVEKSQHQNNVTLRKITKEETVEEYLFYLTHKVNNIKHDDGRIYLDKTENALYANSVSPFSETFEQNIEPKIKPLVDVLIKKRYLTYSSCEGHDLSFRRFVGLAFADEDSRQYVIDYIAKLNIKGITLNSIDSVSNQKSNQKRRGQSIRYEEKYNPLLVENEYETLSFNIQFHRNYSSYFFLEIIILDSVDIGLSLFKNPIKNSWLFFMKIFFWDKLTKRLCDELVKDSFKKYKF